MTEKIVYDADLGCETIGGSSASDAQMLAQMQMLAGGDDDEDADANTVLIVVGILGCGSVEAAAGAVLSR